MADSKPARTVPIATVITLLTAALGAGAVGDRAIYAQTAPPTIVQCTACDAMAKRLDAMEALEQAREGRTRALEIGASRVDAKLDAIAKSIDGLADKLDDITSGSPRRRGR
jgi:hypothetical protein